MKRFSPILMCIALLCSSCSLLNMATMGQTATYPTETGQNPGAIPPMMAPNPNSLTATEDPGTGLYGFLNNFGTWAIAPQYAYARNFNTTLGYAIVELQNGRWGAINTLGQTTISFNFRSSYDVEAAMNSIIKGRYRGIDLWVLEDPATGLYGYLDYTGNWFIQPQFYYARDMSSDGYAIVEVSDGQWGAINRSGQIVIQPNFRSSYDAERALNELTRR